MKTLLSLAIILSFVLSIRAQNPIPSNTVNLSGTASFSSQSYDEGDDNRDVLFLNPQVGYFIIDNLSFGLSVNYERISLNSYSTADWGVGPFIRYYLNFDKANPFISVGYNYCENENLVVDENTTVNQYVFSGGLDYFITDNVALEAILSYRLNNHKLPEAYSVYYKNLEIKSKTFMIGVGFNIFLN